MPLMMWMPFNDIRNEYFDNSTLWAQLIILTLMKIEVMEARLMDEFEDEGEDIINPTYEKIMRVGTVGIYEFRLIYRPRRKKKINLNSRSWFEQEPELQPI
jgi:hypothetical protein